MSVCSLTEASLQADSLITPLHHTTLPSYCRFSTDEGFLCVCRKDYIFCSLELVYICLCKVCMRLCACVASVCVCVHVCVPLLTFQVLPFSREQKALHDLWAGERERVCGGFTCMFIYPSPAYLPLPSLSLSHTQPGLRRRGSLPLSSVYVVRSAISNDH